MTEFFTAADGARLAYTDEGEGLAAVVSCRADPRDRVDFDYLLPHLPPCRVIRMDYRGRGDSAVDGGRKLHRAARGAGCDCVAGSSGRGQGGGAGHLARRVDRHGAGGDGEGPAAGPVPERRRPGDRARRGWSGFSTMSGAIRRPGPMPRWRRGCRGAMPGFEGVRASRWLDEAQQSLSWRRRTG